MLNSFHVKNFRLFENLEVKNLNRVNLMVGRNNAGKSTFLEALEVYISNAAPAVIEEYKATWQIVKTENMSSRKLAELLDITSFIDLELEVISALKLIDDRVSGVTFVADVSQKISPVENRIPLVKLAGIDEPLPLKSMGDGMTRLFHIILALVNAKDGFLLIDEFENGLHWTVQPKVWDIVFQLADKLNVQVFATTHSRDCMAGFDQAWNQYCDRGAFFRFDVKDGQIKATEYTSETLTDAIEMDVEVR